MSVLSGCIICVLALGSARIMWCFRFLCVSSLVRVLIPRNYPHYVDEFSFIMDLICKMQYIVELCGKSI